MNGVKTFIKGKVRRGISLMLIASMLVSVPATTAWGASAVKNDESLRVGSLGYYPGGILTDDDGYVYVKDCGYDYYTRGQVYRYTPSGILDTSWGSNGRTAIPTTDRGVGLSFAPDGNIITTCYDGSIHKVNIENGETMKTINDSSFTPYCSVLSDGKIYIIGRAGSTKKIKVYDDSLTLVSDANLGAPDGSIPVSNGYYGLAIAGDRLYTTEFGSVVYGYKKSGNGWVKDTSFGSNGTLSVFYSSAGGLFYNEDDDKVYVCSESDNKIFNFNTDGSNLTQVLSGAGPNNLYISDKGYAVPFFGGQAFQVFYRLTETLQKDTFSVKLGGSVKAETKDPLKLTVTTTAQSSRAYEVQAQLIGEDGKTIEANCPKVKLTRGSADLTITPAANWKPGNYSVQLVVTSTVGGTSISISETFKIDAKIAVGMYKVYFEQPSNGSLDKAGYVNVSQAPGNAGSIVNVKAAPAADYELDIASSVIEPEGAIMSAVGNDITISGITQDIGVTVAFKMSAAKLDEKKQAAIAELKASIEGADSKYKAEDYFGENWEKLTECVKKAEESILNATKPDEVSTILFDTQRKMAEIPNKSSDANRKELVEAANKAINDKFAGYKETDYTTEEWAKLVTAKEEALAGVQAAVTEQEINTARESGLRDMAAIPSKAQQELLVKKEEVRKELEQAKQDLKVETEYEGDSLTEINNKYTELTYEIENATNTDGLKDIAAELEEFIKAGDYLKKSVKDELIAAINQWITDHPKTGYTDQNWNAIQTYKNVGIAAVNGSSKETLATSAKETAIANMTSVKTKNEQLTEDRKPYLDAVKAAFEKYKEADYSAENWAKLEKFYEDALSAIAATEKPAEMEAAKNTASAGMNAVESLAAALKAIKDSAIVEIQTEYKNLSEQTEQYSKAGLEELNKLSNQWKATISGSATAQEIAANKDMALEALKAVKKIAITISAEDITFDEIAYTDSVPSAQKLSITATLEGCTNVTVTDVAISSEDGFDLAVKGTDHSVTADKANEDWSVSPKSGLIPADHTAVLTISYNCEGKAAGTKTVNVSMKVRNASQDMPDTLKVKHETAADAKDGTITGVTTAMEWKKQTDTSYTPVAADGNLSLLEPGTYDIRLAAKEYYDASDIKSYTVKKVQSDALGLTVADETGFNMKDGSITVSSPAEAVEYRDAQSSQYIKVDTTIGQELVIDGLTAGTYYVRYQETDYALAGKDKQAVISTGSYSVTYKYDARYGSITAEDGGEAPATVTKNGSVIIRMIPADGYELKSSGITCEKANCQIREDGTYILSSAIDNVVLKITFTTTAEKDKLDAEIKDALDDVDKIMTPEIAADYLDHKDDLNALRTAAGEEIRTATDSNAVKEMKDQGIAAIEAAKEAAMEDYRDRYASPSDAILGDRDEADYSKENWDKLKDYQEAAKKALKDETTPKALVEKLDKIFDKVTDIPTLEQESDDYKKLLDEKKSELTASMSDAIPNDKQDYSPGGWKKIENLLEDARKAIEDALTLEAVEEIWQKLCDALTAIPTAQEELDTAIEQAIATLFQTYTYQYDENDYTEDYWTMLEEYYSEGMENIENAQNPAAVEKLLQKVLKDMKDVKTLKEMGSEQKKEPEVIFLEDYINKLPNPANASDEQLEAARDKIIHAKELYDALDSLKEQMDENVVAKLNKLIIKLMNITLEIRDSSAMGVKASGLLGLTVNPEEMNGGSDIQVILNVAVKEGQEEDEEAVLALLGSQGKIGSYLDISIEKLVDGISTMITSLIKPVELRITIPENMRGHKNYKVIRIHDGEVIALDTKQDGNTLIFFTDKFSTYVLTYETEKSGGGSGSGSGGSGGSGGFKGAVVAPGPQSTPGTWKQDTAGWWFQPQSGSYPKSQWLFIGEFWYYFNEAGYMQTGWQTINNARYYLRSDGAMSVNWVMDNDKWYFMTASGAMAAKQWVSYQDGWYYMQEDGTLMRNQLFEYESQWYYLGSDGRMAVDMTIDGRYFDQDGVRK